MTDVLNAHNSYRARHGMPNNEHKQTKPLKWNSQLAAEAQTWADRGAFQHSSGNYGENLAAGYPSLTAAVDAWYNEVSSYNYNKPGFSGATGHFTQVVWAASEELGCGYAENGNTRRYLVCRYLPAGNVMDQFEENVLPLL